MSPEQDTRAKRDGCECPEWVRCVHFEGQILWLADMHHPALHRALDRGGHIGLRGRWCTLGGDSVRPCTCGAPAHLILAGRTTPLYYTDSLPEAQARFQRQAAILMGREPEPALP